MDALTSPATVGLRVDGATSLMIGRPKVLGKLRSTMKKLLLLSLATVGLAMLFSSFETAPAAAQRTTSDDVRLVTEETVSELAPAAGRNGNTGRNGRNYKSHRTYRDYRR